MVRTFLIPILSGLFCFHANAGADGLYPCNLEVRTPGATASSPGLFSARAYVEDLSVAISDPIRFRWVTVTAPKDGTWSALLAPTDEFHSRIQSLSFPQSLESLGVSYRMGFCYQGPVAVKSNGNSGHDSSEGSYGLVGTVDVGATAGGIVYNGTLTGSCDLRSVGTSKDARGTSELYPQKIESDMQFSINLGILASGGMDFQSMINSISNRAPRFCKINIEVDESSDGNRPFDVNVNEAQFTLQIDKNLL